MVANLTFFYICKWVVYLGDHLEYYETYINIDENVSGEP